MATYTVPYQNLSFNVPDQNQVFRDSASAQGEALYTRIGNSIVGLNFQNIGSKLPGVSQTDGRMQIATGRDYIKSLGINVDAVPGYNMADVSTAFGQVQPFSGDYSQFKQTPTGSGETITKSISPTNPYGADVNSSVSGNISTSNSLAQNLQSARAENPNVTDAQVQALTATGMANGGTPYTAQQLQGAGITPTPTTVGGKTGAPQISAQQYQLQPNESIVAYNARIASLRGETPASATPQQLSQLQTTLEALKAQDLNSLTSAQRDVISKQITDISKTIGTLQKPTASAPTVSGIASTTNPPASGTTAPPNLPAPTATGAMATYMASATAEIANLKAQIETESKKRADEYQTQIDALTKKNQDLQVLQENNMLNEGSTMRKEVMDKQEQLDLEKQRVDENYNANQALVNEMDALLTTGNQVISQMQATTGLNSIMSPRIAKTMSDVAARAGVIQAVLAARNGQIGVAQNQLSSSFAAIESIANDQIDYYKELQSFYEGKKDDNNKQILDAKSDQKTYLDQKLISLQNDLVQAQATTKLIQQAMIDPDKATAYARAGVTLTDTPEQIAGKLSQYAYTKEVADTSNKMTLDGAVYLAPGQAVPAGYVKTQTVDSKGVVKNWAVKGTSTAATQSWSAPYLLGGDYVQKNLTTGEIRTAVNVASPTSPSGKVTGEEIKQYINKQMATPEFKKFSDADKKDFILLNGGTPSDFGIY